ncbi:copper-binding protein [Lentilactobacillus fungorum]|uniref:Copper-binding protein n=1 Tax=Lentilactobacillus fungorum TaxID=2201250 RepID=A0ABQ3VYA4_9LACO|nr:cupredoxin domain-containing protein [Lentilactobacillus fungorum]GHP13880.1 copper-binding protein [Lentilactobacillus fungorum]
MDQKEQNATIIVSGGYQPEVIKLKQGIPAKLSFKRVSEQGCLDVVHSKELGFEATLPFDVVKVVSVPTDKAGEFSFSCGMDMFFGKVEVEP